MHADGDKFTVYSPNMYVIRPPLGPGLSPKKDGTLRSLSVVYTSATGIIVWSAFSAARSTDKESLNCCCLTGWSIGRFKFFGGFVVVSPLLVFFK